MKKRLIAFFLLTIFIQIKPIKVFFSKIVVSTVYFPVLYGYSRVQRMLHAEKEADILRKKLSKCIVKRGSVRAQYGDTTLNDSIFVVSIIGYEPFGYPGILTYFPPYGKRGDILLWNGILAGKVISKENLWGKALTLYGNMFRIGVIIRKYSGIMEGGIPPVVKYIPIEYEVKSGDTVYTSGIGESNIRGIPVGIVKKVEKDEIFPYFHKIEVKPFFEVHRAYRLTLVKNG